LTAGERDDEGPDNGLKAGCAAKAAELFVFRMLFAAGGTLQVSDLLRFRLSGD
jgi:hypothetical protein